MSTNFDAAAYARNLMNDTGFENTCIRARQNFNIRQLRRIRPRRILEIGCGNDLLFDRAVEADIPFECWTVIEPASALCDLCRERSQFESRLVVIESLCEEAAPKLR